MDTFAHTKHQVYLNHAAMGPYSLPVKEAILKYVNQRHIEKIDNYLSFEPIVNETYHMLGSLLGTQGERLCLTPNTSTGLNILAKSFPWQKGDRVLINNQEFPANVYPFLNCQALGVNVDFFGKHDKPLQLQEIEQALTPKTKILTISMVQFLSGQRIDLNKVNQLCKENGTLLCVDAIQGLGATDINVENTGIDFLACGSHKWLMAPEGLGFIYLSKALQDTLTPVFAGWFSVNNAWDLFDYKLSFLEDAKCFETGTMNHIAIAGLHASLKILFAEGFSQISHKVQNNSLFFIERFPNLNWLTPIDERLGIATFKHPKAQEIYETLYQHKITVSVREKQYIRISPHYYHEMGELERAASHLETALNGH